MNYLSCLAEIIVIFTYFSEGVSKNKRCRIFRRNTVNEKEKRFHDRSLRHT